MRSVSPLSRRWAAPLRCSSRLKRRWREHKAARELGGWLDRGERGAVTVRAGG